MLENHFMVVHWEQRGAGKSFLLLLTDRRRMTWQQYLADGLELATYLRQRLGQDKMFLVGHSWGTFLGIWMAQRRPGWFWAYVGIGQMVNAMANDQMFYDLTLERARRDGDQRTERALLKIGRPPYTGRPLSIARKTAKIDLPNWRYMNADIAASGGTPTAGPLADAAGIPEYRRLDHLYTVAGTALTYGTVYPHLEAEGIDLQTQVPALEVPIYLAEGRWDLNAPPALAEDYLQTLTAPAKHLEWFERSGHNPCYEEPLQHVHDRHGARRSIGRPDTTLVIIENVLEAAMPWNRAVAGMAAGGVTGLTALAVRYAAGVARANKEWPAQVEAGLSGHGEVDEVSILPLVERLTPEGSSLHGEPGVSYLVRAGGRRVLFDSGLSGGKPVSALAHNARVLGEPLGDLDAVVVSHLHADHVGGLQAMRQRTFAFSGKPLEPRGVPGVPAHPDAPPARGCDGHLRAQADRARDGGAAAAAPDAVLDRVRHRTGAGGQRPRLRPGADQRLWSPRIEQILGVAERVLDVPIRAVAGGLHLPVHAAGPRWFRRRSWATRTRRGSRSANATPRVCWRNRSPPADGGLVRPRQYPMGYDAFARDRYRTLRAGEELRITAASG